MLHPDEQAATFYALLPASVLFAEVGAASANLVGSIALLTGVGMTAMEDQRGPHVVRVTCAVMSGVVVAIGGLGMLAAATDSTYSFLGLGVLKFLGANFLVILGMLSGAGGVVGGLLGWLVLLVLFRRSRTW